MSSFIRTLRTSGAFAASMLILNAAVAAGSATHMPSPVTVAAGQSLPYGTALELRPTAYAETAGVEALRIESFPLSPTRFAALDLRQVRVFAADAVLVEMTESGPREIPRPELSFFSGRMADDAGSTAFLAIAPDALNGMITTSDGETYIVSSGPLGAGHAPVVYRLGDVGEEWIWTDFECAADQIAHPIANLVPARPAGVAGTRGDAPCRVATIAIETDVEYRQLLGGTAQATAYTGVLIGANSEIYTRDVNTRLEIGFLRIWSGNSNSDPWNQGGTVSQLFQFQDYWNANMTDIERHAAHFLSGRGLGGGVAYKPGLCIPEYDYGLSANLNGFFPYPIQNNHSQNWDLMVTAHELGHNFDASHTHDLNPPVDGCASGDCSVTPNGTIMSYCHLCSGGLANVRMEMHPRNINEEMLPWLQNNPYCDTAVAVLVITSHPQSVEACEGDFVELSVTVTGDGPIEYQWRRNGTDIGGATSAVYYIASVNAGNVGDYDVVCTGPCGETISDAAAVTLAPSYAGDLDGDCAVTLADLSILLSSYGLCAGDAGYNPDADIDGDGCVGLGDLSMLLVDFGAGS